MADFRNAQAGASRAGLSPVQLGEGNNGALALAWHSRRPTQAAGAYAAQLTARNAGRSAYYFTAALIALTVVIVHAAIPAKRFSDYDAYLFYLDQLTFFRDPDWYYFEGLSKVTLLLLRNLMGSTVGAIDIAHLMISAVYLIGMMVVFPPSLRNWRGMLATFALFGPQLAFVTVRATPAYFIAAVAVLQAIRGQNRSFFFVVLATLFHISSVLALAPILALFAHTRFWRLTWLEKPKNLLRALGVLALLFVLLGSQLFEAIRVIFQAIPFLGKYLVFTVGLSEAGGVTNLAQTFAVGHFVLFAFVTAFVLAFLTLGNALTKRVGIFVVISYLLYAFTFLGLSPIAAFRQTPFWMIPAFAVFPWRSVGWRGSGNVLFLAGVAGVFAFQFSRVIAY